MPSRPRCDTPPLSDRGWLSPLSGNHRPDPLRRSRHHGAGRTPVPFDSAGGDRPPQACGHRPAARARFDVPFHRPTTSGRQLAVQIPRQLQQ